MLIYSKQPITEVHCVLLLLAALVIVLMDDSHSTSVYKIVFASAYLDSEDSEWTDWGSRDS